MRSCVDAGARNEVVLSLKWPGSVNYNVRSEPPQLRSKVGRVRVEHRGLDWRTSCICHRPRLLRVTTGDDYPMSPIGSERSDDESAEIAVAAENDCTTHAAFTPSSVSHPL